MIYWAKKQKPKKPKILRARRRVPFLRREKAAMIKLRRVGLSINQISDFLGRSRSIVHKVVKRAEGYGLIRRFSLRKSAHSGRLRLASFRWSLLLRLQEKWIKWICGERTEPP
jgi:DNA-binding Lrp family transcriptional regulator